MIARRHTVSPASITGPAHPAGYRRRCKAASITSILGFSGSVKRAPITECHIETVRFDTQAMQNPEIAGVEYQQGELAGYEVREYLLEKWHRLRLLR